MEIDSFLEATDLRTHLPERSPLAVKRPSLPGCVICLFVTASVGSETLAQIQQRHGEVREEDEAHLLGEADVQLPWRRTRGKARIEEPLREVRQGGCQVLTKVPAAAPNQTTFRPSTTRSIAL